MAIFAPTKCALTGLPIADGARVIGMWIAYCGYDDPKTLYRDDHIVDGGWVPFTFLFRGSYNGNFDLNDDINYCGGQEIYEVQWLYIEAEGLVWPHLRYTNPTKIRLFLVLESVYDELCDRLGYQKLSDKYDGLCKGLAMQGRQMFFEEYFPFPANRYVGRFWPSEFAFKSSSKYSHYRTKVEWDTALDQDITNLFNKFGAPLSYLHDFYELLNRFRVQVRPIKRLRQDDAWDVEYWRNDVPILTELINREAKRNVSELEKEAQK